MEAKLERHGDITVVHLRGKLDLENNLNFRSVCLNKFTQQKVIFCLRDLRFVGSSGIQTFFRTLKDIHARNKYGIKVSGLKADFMRLLQYTAVAGLEIHESSDVAVQSFVTGIPGGLQLEASVTDSMDIVESPETATGAQPAVEGADPASGD